MNAPQLPPQSASEVVDGSNTWGSRQSQMGFGTTAWTATSSMPGGQGYAPAAAVTAAATSASDATPVAAQGWMMLGRRMAMRH